MKAIEFKNNKGHTIRLNPKMTLSELVKLGMINIKLVPKEKPSPLKNNWWEHKT